MVQKRRRVSDGIYWDDDGVHVKSPDGLESDDLMSEWMLSTAVDPSSGEIVNGPDFPDETIPVPADRDANSKNAV